MTATALNSAIFFFSRTPSDLQIRVANSCSKYMLQIHVTRASAGLQPEGEGGQAVVLEATCEEAGSVCVTTPDGLPVHILKRPLCSNFVHEMY